MSMTFCFVVSGEVQRPESLIQYAQCKMRRGLASTTVVDECCRFEIRGFRERERVRERVGEGGISVYSSMNRLRPRSFIMAMTSGEAAGFGTVETAADVEKRGNAESGRSFAGQGKATMATAPRKVTEKRVVRTERWRARKCVRRRGAMFVERYVCGRCSNVACSRTSSLGVWWLEADVGCEDPFRCAGVGKMLWPLAQWLLAVWLWTEAFGGTERAACPSTPALPAAT